MATFNKRPPSFLRSSVSIVGPDGRPTPEFLRAWQQQRELNRTTEELIAEVEANAAAVAALNARRVDGTSGEISGGGALGGGNIALGLASTGVVPDTYGDATTVPQITVDAFGRLTSVASVPISGGGGGGGGAVKGVGNVVGSVSVANSTLTGPKFTPTYDVELVGLWGLYRALSNDDPKNYVFGVASLSGDTVDVVLATADGADYSMPAFLDFAAAYSEAFTSPLSLTAGQDYFIYIYRKTGSADFGMGVRTSNAGINFGLPGDFRNRYTVTTNGLSAGQTLTQASTIASAAVFPQVR